MRWQRAARRALAAIGLVSAAAIVYFARQGTPSTSAPPVAAVDPSASLEGGKGTSVWGEGNSRVRIDFESSRRYDDGRMHFDRARVEGLDEHRFTLTAAVLETSGTGGDRPLDYDLTGGVVLDTDDGLHLETERGHYNDNSGRVDMPGSVTFTRGRMNGRATGAVYDRKAETIQLLRDARVEIAPDQDGRGHAVGTATQMTLVRGQKSVRLEQNAQIDDDNERMTADIATLYFTPDERALKYLELRGRAVVAPQANTDEAPDMRAENITLSFQADGRTLQHSTLTGGAVLTMREAGQPRTIRGSWLDLYTGPDGRTLTRLDARDEVVVELPASGDAPSRTIWATTLSATGSEAKGLTAARFDGHPRLEERSVSGASTAVRTGTADALVLALDGGLGAIKAADFRQSARFVDGDMTAEADLAVYQQAAGSLHLQPSGGASGRRSRVTSPDLTVEARVIDLALETHNLTAEGSVTTRSTGRPRDAASARANPGLLDADRPVFGSAEALTYQRDSGTAVYTGTAKVPARLKQDQTEIAATTVRVADASGNLEATGRVDSVLMVTPAAPPGEPASGPRRYHVVANSLAYDDVLRTAVYRGEPVTMTSDDAQTEGRTLTLSLGAETRTVDRMHVEAKVYAKMSGGYEADGDTLVYEASTDTYVITGRPARVKSPNSSGDGCLLTKNLTLELNRRTGSVRSPSHGQAPGSTDAIGCDVSIRTIR